MLRLWLTERERCARPYLRSWRYSTITRWHGTVDGHRVLAVEATALGLWAERSDFIPLIEMVVVWRHGVLSHTASCWRL